MTRRKSPLKPHPFVPDPQSRDWRDRLWSCDRCGLARHNRVHTEHVAPEDDSSRILGEGNAA